MKKIMLAVLLFSFLASTISAQDGRVRKNLEAQKVAFITQKLELTPKEAEVFWPVYNQFQREKEAISKKYKMKKRLANMTEQELEAHMMGTFKKDQELLDLKKNFFTNMKKDFSIRRITTLMAAEREFRNTILDTWKKKQKERRQERRQNRQKNMQDN